MPLPILSGSRLSGCRMTLGEGNNGFAQQRLCGRTTNIPSLGLADCSLRGTPKFISSGVFGRTIPILGVLSPSSCFSRFPLSRCDSCSLSSLTHAEFVRMPTASLSTQLAYAQQSSSLSTPTSRGAPSFQELPQHPCSASTFSSAHGTSTDEFAVLRLAFVGYG